MTSQDKWSQWLLQTRFGGDADNAARELGRLRDIRDRILRDAALKEGQTLLDVGCGDGLVAFGALERVGATGRVVFSDVSRPLLEHCEKLAAEAGLRDRCSFIEARADDLHAISDESVDAVTTRSVLIFVKDKAKAFGEFHRVLRRRGRLSIFEPINRFNETYALAGDWWQTEGSPIADLGKRLHDHYRSLQALDSDPMMDFDQHDLVELAEQAGFRSVHLAYHVLVFPAPPVKWDVMTNSPGNPNIPSMAEAMRRIFTDDERSRFEEHLRPTVEAGGRTSHSAVAYLTATKESGMDTLDG